MTSELYELNCPFCDKLYKLPRDKVIKHAGKSIHCRKCGQPFSIPTLPPDDVVEEPLAPVEMLVEEQTPAVEMGSASVEPSITAEPPVSESSSEEAVMHEPLEGESHKNEEPAEYAPPYPPFSTDEALEPPPLSEYGETSLELTAETPSPSISEHEPIEDGISEDFEDSLPASIAEALNESPEASSYFSGAMIADEAPVAATADHGIAPISQVQISDVDASIDHEALGPHAPIESEPMADSEFGSFDEISLSDEGAKPVDFFAEPNEVGVVEPLPPALPPKASRPLPPKLRRGARAAVSPVFDAPVDEPVARRRGKAGGHPEPIDPIDAAAEHPIESVVAPESTSFESAYKEHPLGGATTEIDSAGKALMSGADDVPTLSMEPERADRLSTVNSPTELLATSTSPQTSEDLSAIRRSVALLATMSVIITLVLIAILLTLIGIIPKK